MTKVFFGNILQKIRMTFIIKSSSSSTLKDLLHSPRKKLQNSIKTEVHYIKQLTILPNSTYHHITSNLIKEWVRRRKKNREANKEENKEDNKEVNKEEKKEDNKEDEPE